MAKLNIDNNSLAEYFFDDCRIFGIVAPIKDYQFTWHINRQMGLAFRANNSLEIELKKKGRQYYFSVFEHVVPNSMLVYYLYNNEHDGEYLLPEFKHLDYLWLTKYEDITTEELTGLMQNVRSIPGVQLVTELEATKIKNKQHLIL